MGHRKHRQPRRGSLAYLPKARARSMEPRIKCWTPKKTSVDHKEAGEEPKLQGHVGFKAGCVHIAMTDDREHTPNYGKQLVTYGTVIVTPPINIIGIRAYHKDNYGKHVLFDVYSKDMPKEITRMTSGKRNIDEKKSLENAEKHIGKISEIYAVVAVIPKKIGLEQKKPYVFEIPITGAKNDTKKQFKFLKEKLGKEVKCNEAFQNGAEVDVASISKGKGWEGPVTRWGVKRKQHKSRKSVREVATLGPWKPHTIRYTVPRAGQKGFSQRIEYNKRIMMMDNIDNSKLKINPDGGFKHFGFVKGDFVVLKGSIPGSNKRMVKIRSPIRSKISKLVEPKIVEVMA